MTQPTNLHFATRAVDDRLLPEYEYARAPSVHNAVMQLDKGWSLRDVVSYLLCMIEFGSTMSEEDACSRMRVLEMKDARKRAQRVRWQGHGQ